MKNSIIDVETNESLEYVFTNTDDEFTMSLDEKRNYGGAWDIDPEQYFSREEINEFDNQVSDEIDDRRHSNSQVQVHSEIENYNTLETYVDGDLVSSIKIDFRRLRNKGLWIYLDDVVTNVIDYLNELNESSQILWTEDDLKTAENLLNKASNEAETKIVNYAIDVIKAQLERNKNLMENFELEDSENFTIGGDSNMSFRK